MVRARRGSAGLSFHPGQRVGFHLYGYNANSNADFHTDSSLDQYTYTHIDGDSYTHADSLSDTHRQHSDTDPNSYIQPDFHRYYDAYANLNCHLRKYLNPNCNLHPDIHCNRYWYWHSNPHPHSHGYNS